MWRSRVRDLPEFGGELPVSTLADEILTPGEGQVRAVLTLAGNPVSSTPDGPRLAGALAGLDFMAAVDIYVNETTRHADVILPPTTALERDHYDLVFHALAVRNTARFTPGGARQARRRDARLGDLPRDRAPHAAAAARPAAAEGPAGAGGADAGLPDPDRRRAAAHRRGPGSRVRRLRRGSVDLGPLEPCLPERLMTPTKRIDAAPRQVVEDLARLDAAAVPDGAAAGRPAAPARQQLLDAQHAPADQGTSRATSC